MSTNYPDFIPQYGPRAEDMPCTTTSTEHRGEHLWAIRTPDGVIVHWETQEQAERIFEGLTEDNPNVAADLIGSVLLHATTITTITTRVVYSAWAEVEPGQIEEA